MSKTSREKEKPLERLKSLFGLGKGGSSSGPGFAVPKIEEFAITPEIVRVREKDKTNNKIVASFLQSGQPPLRLAQRGLAPRCGGSLRA